MQSYFFYKVLVEKKLSINFLTYKSRVKIRVGGVVLVPLRNKIIWGMIIGLDQSVQQIEIEKIKEIKKVYPINISNPQKTFLFSLAYNTFNSPNLMFAAIAQPLQIIAEKYWKDFEQKISHKDHFKKETEQLKKDSGNKDNKVEFHLDKDITFRIRDIIRSYILQLETSENRSAQILVVFPEKKMLDQKFKEIKIMKFAENLDFQIDFYKYYSGANKYSRETILSLIETSLAEDRPPTLQSKNRKIEIVFGTKNSLFLPFTTLDKIVLVDEPNSFYIQDQNSLYYDARDAAFLLSSAFFASLDFVSKTPSVRLHNSYSKKVLNKFEINYTNKLEKPPKIEIIRRNSDCTFNNLFSEVILEDIGIEYKED